MAVPEGFCLHFVYFFVTLLAFPQLSTSAKADVMAWRRLLASLPPRAREGLGPRGQDSDDVVQLDMTPVFHQV